MQRSHTSGYIGTARGKHKDERDAQLGGDRGSLGQCVSVVRGERAPPDVGFGPDNHGRASTQIFHPGPDRTGDQPPDDRGGRGVQGHPPMVRTLG